MIKQRRLLNKFARNKNTRNLDKRAYEDWTHGRIIFYPRYEKPDRAFLISYRRILREITGNENTQN